jgi:hypothetical protein
LYDILDIHGDVVMERVYMKAGRLEQVEAYRGIFV